MACPNSRCPFSEVKPGNGRTKPAAPECMIADVVKQVNIQEGENLFTKGERTCCLYAVTDGLVKIIDHSPSGGEQIVGLSTPSALLTGLQSLGEEEYQYSAVAATNVSACKLRHRALLTSVKSGSEIAVRLVSAINTQLAYSRALMRVLGHRSAAAKIASFLELIFPESLHDNKRYALPFSRHEIADMLGLSEETVCRQMAKMRRRGILYAPRGGIEVYDWEKLHAIADGTPSASGRAAQVACASAFSPGA